MRIIITADDFGMSSSVNKAIMLAFENGLVTRASIMPTMTGFEEACSMSRGSQVCGRIGLHVDLLEGRALTSHIAQCPRFCNESGTFLGKRTERFWLSPQETKAVEEELEAQWRACEERDIQISHVDSHHHYHTVWPISTAVIKLAKRHNIPAVRLAKNCTPQSSFLRRTYKAVHNARLRMHGLAAVKYFGSASEVVANLPFKNHSIEVMVHPRLNEAGQLVDLDGRKLQSVIAELGLPDPHKNCGDTKVETGPDAYKDP